MHPALTPALAEVFGPAARDATITVLRGGITNRNFRVDLAGASYVARVYGDRSERLGIDRAAEVACQEAAHAQAIAPAVVRFLPRHRVLLSRFVPGETLDDERARDPARLPRIVAQLRRCHRAARFPGRFCPFATVRAYLRDAVSLGVDLPPAWEAARARLAGLETALGEGETAACHNDLLAGNFIDDGQKVWIVDWEYAAMGDPFFDLGNFAVNQGLDATGRAELLRLYRGAVRAEDIARLDRMRAVSDAREAAWAFLQVGLSSLDFDYVAYGEKHLHRFLEATG